MSESEEEVSSGRASTNPSPSAELEAPKHPLQNSWTLWYFKKDGSKDWESNQKQVITFNTVEDFWALYNHIESASKLSTGCDYSLFKEGIRPMWEDSLNEAGGKWQMQIDKRHRYTNLDRFWLEVMMCLIGEAFAENGVLVNGAVVNIRPKVDKISIWLSESSENQKEAIMSIGRCLKNRLQLSDQEQISFEVHKDSMTRHSSMVKRKFFV